MKIAGVQMDIKIMEPGLNLANMEKGCKRNDQQWCGIDHIS